MTGFIGADQSKTITTLGRGGSDLSASVLGAVLDADEVTMYKVESEAAADGTLGPFSFYVCWEDVYVFPLALIARHSSGARWHEDGKSFFLIEVFFT